MKTLLLCMVAVSVSTAAVLWDWTFQQLPAEWTADEYWDFSANGAHCFVTATASGPYHSYQSSSAVSPVYTVPEGVTHLLVTVTSDWDLSGWATTGESHCYVWARMDTAENWYSGEFASRSWGFDTPVSFTGTDEVMIPISGNMEFTLSLFSDASASFGGGATAEWTVNRITITDQNGTALSRNTWGAIKASF